MDTVLETSRRQFLDEVSNCVPSSPQGVDFAAILDERSEQHPALSHPFAIFRLVNRIPRGQRE